MNKLNKNVIFILIASIIKIALIPFYHDLTQNFSERVEIDPPNNSYIRLEEAFFLIKQNHSPYSSDVFYGSPFSLFLLYPLKNFPRIYVCLFLEIFNIVTAFSLYAILNIHDSIASKQNQKISNLNNKNKIIFNIETSLFNKMPYTLFVPIFFLLNPFAIFSSIGMATIGFSYCFSSLAILFSIQNMIQLTALFLSQSIVLDIYPSLLVFPIIIILNFGLIPSNSKHLSNKCRFISKTIYFLILLFTFTIALLYFAKFILGDQSFIKHSYKFWFTCHDQKPNIGIFWYFYIEIFERFRSFFIYIFNGHILVYVCALSARFWREPLFTAHIIYSIIITFKMYPVIGDVSFMFSSLIMQYRLLKYLQPLLPLIYVYCSCSVLGVLMQFLWIHSGSGNANFYFNQTILFSFCSCQLIFQSIHSARKTLHFRRKYEEKNYLVDYKEIKNNSSSNSLNGNKHSLKKTN